ncbi:MAG: DNA repair protein RecN, partial [Clostridia bacterium]|nr:DNA repair protein RecN [Clostridia bacterium]
GLIYSALDSLTELKKYYSSLSQVSDGVAEAVYAVEECISSVSSCMEEFEYESIDINSVEERLDVLWRLSKKYGGDEEQMLLKLDELRSQCEELENSDNELNLLRLKINEKKNEVYEVGTELSETRRIAGNEFSASVMRHLSQLDMPSVILKVERTEIPACRDGIDSIRFLISVNPGETPKELNRVASGGELSRIMLAIKSVLAGCDGIPTMIFDEIDTGVSGSAAGKMAKKLKKIACDGRQVICVTHLAKLACYASSHFYISKQSSDGVTRTSVRLLENKDRIEEIARIIGGDSVTSTALKNANEMLILAQNDENV